MKTKEYRISWTWNNITLSLWIRIDVKTLRTVGLRLNDFPTLIPAAKPAGFAAIYNSKTIILRTLRHVVWVY